jgi:hypothetical protein
MNSDNNFLFIWIKTHAYFYKLVEDNKLTNVFLENIHDEDFLYKFYTLHFKSSRRSFGSMSAKFIMNSLLDHLDYFSFPKSATKDYIQTLFNGFRAKENKLKIWKVIFTLSFIEEYCFNKFIKIKENLSVSDLSVNIITNKGTELPRLYSFKKLMKNPIFLKSITGIVNEVLSEINVGTDYQTSILNYFYEDRSKTLEYSLKLDAGYKSDSYYECSTPPEIRKESLPFSFGGNDGRLCGTPNSQSDIVYKDNKSFQYGEDYEEYSQSDKGGFNFHFLNNIHMGDSYKPNSLNKSWKCFKCEEYLLKIDELNNHVKDMEAGLTNLSAQLKLKEDEVKNLHNYNILLGGRSVTLEDTIKAHERKIYVLTRSAKEMEERLKFYSGINTELERKEKLIVDLNDQLASFGATKRLLEEYRQRLEYVNDESKARCIESPQNIHINNYNIYNANGSTFEGDKNEIRELEKKIQSYEDMIIVLNKLLRRKENALLKCNENNEELRLVNKNIREKRNRFRKLIAYASVFQVSAFLVYMFNYYS